MTLAFIAPPGVDFSANALRQINTINNALPDFGAGLERLHLLRGDLESSAFDRAALVNRDFSEPFGPITFDSVRASAATRRDRIDYGDYEWDWAGGFTFAIATRGPLTTDETVFVASNSNIFNTTGLFFRISAARRIRLQVAVDAGLAEAEIMRPSGFFPQNNDVLIFCRFDPAAGNASVYTPDNDEIGTAALSGSGTSNADPNGARLLGDGTNTAARVSEASLFASWNRPLSQAEMQAAYDNMKPWLAEQGVEIR